MGGQRTKASGIGSWLSPAGVITGGRFAFRLLSVAAFIVLSMLLLGLSAQIENEAIQRIVDGSTAVFLIVGLPLAIWVILTSLTKHYRTSGVWAPFLFALITPVMPFMFFVTWVFSSKERAKTSLRLAKEQAKAAKLEKGDIAETANLQMPEQTKHDQHRNGEARSRNADNQSVVRRMR